MKITIQASDTSCGTWRYFDTDSIKLWWSSPKAFGRSINVIVSERCLRRVSFMTRHMLAKCSKVPIKPCMNPFCIEVSIYLLLCKNSNTLSLNNDVKIFNITGSNVTGLKFEGSDLSPFLKIKMVAARCHNFGIDFRLRISLQISSTKLRKMEHILKHDGHLIKRTEWAQDFHSFDYFAYLQYVGGERSNSSDKSLNFGIQSGIANSIVGLTAANNFLKWFLHFCLSNSGSIRDI